MSVIKITNDTKSNEEKLVNIEKTLFSTSEMIDNINDIRKNENWEKAKNYNLDEEW